MPPERTTPRFNSLWLRLLAGATLWSFIALVVAGLILISLYRQTVERQFDERLEVYLKTLIGTLATQNSPTLEPPGNLGEQRFEQLYSGWYWQVSRADDGDIVLASASLFTDAIDLSQALSSSESDGITRAVLEGPEGQRLRALEREITFQTTTNPVPYPILVAGNASELSSDIANFVTSVVVTLAVVGFGLIVSTVFPVRWGLRPLDRVRSGLADLRSGKEHSFEGPFPVEIAPLARELNAVLLSNKEIIERARTQVGNLAHALKTPLSVITNEARASDGAFAGKVAEQAELMRVQINHYLNRARIAARSEVIGSITEVRTPVERLVRAMNRIYGDRGVTVTLDMSGSPQFAGEVQDFDDIIGNLVDNACKWANSEVRVSVQHEPPRSEIEHGRLAVLVDDDGPGLTPEQCAEATRRGRRLDESKPGSGLGLSIVTDIVAMYAGRFSLGRAPTGGLRAEVELPGA